MVEIRNRFRSCYFPRGKNGSDAYQVNGVHASLVSRPFHIRPFGILH